MTTEHEQDASGPVASMIEAKPEGETPEVIHEPADEPAQDVEDAAPAPGPVADEICTEIPLELRVESLLFAADRPVAEARLAAVLGLPAKGATKRVRESIEKLNEHYESTKRSFRARRLAGGWQLHTEPDFGPLLSRMHAERMQTRLSQAALETLSIIAYRQPIMRAEIEAIRGVACGEVLRGLLDRRLVKIVGRAEELGRPMLYGTTRQFLHVFGLAGLEDLPTVEGAAPAAKIAVVEESPPEGSPVEDGSPEETPETPGTPESPGTPEPEATADPDAEPATRETPGAEESR